MSYAETLGLEVQMLARGESEHKGVLDPVHQAIAHKALAQAKVIGLDIGIDSTPYGEPTEVGIFRVMPMVARVDWSTPSGALQLKKDTKYLDFHMPPSDDISIDRATEGYSEVAQYMSEQEDIDLILGVTYRVMAMSAKRNHGFDTEQVDLPKPVMGLASLYWRHIMPKINPDKFNTTHVVWQDRERFLDRYLKS